MFTHEELFDLRHTEHKDLFHNTKYAWEAIANIKDCILKNVKSDIQAKIIGQVYIDGLVQIGEGTIVEPGVVIKGPVIIGKNCHLRTNAYIRENSIIGDNVLIGNSCEIKNSLLFNNVAVPHYNYVGDSILGYKAHLGAGVILSNVKTPPREIKVQTLEKTYSTGLLKFGALIGDDSEIGCNSVLNPGSVIGKNCVIYPGIIIRNVISSNSIVKLIQDQEIVIKQKR